MKKVLIIAYCFPPMPAVGSQRSYKLAKYFQYFGWEPTILTVERPGDLPGDVRVIATAYTDRIVSIKRMIGFDPGTGVHEQWGIPVTKNFNYPTWKSKTIGFVRQVIAFPDDARGWYRHAVKTASELLDKEKVDAVISTSYPVTSHLIARKIKQQYGIPWVADLRDLWTQNHYYRKSGIVSFFEQRLEMKTLSDADMLVTISEPLVDVLKSRYLNKDVRCVTNGYDPDDFEASSTGLAENFTITYTGSLYNGKRDPSMLLETIAELIKEGKIARDRAEIRFFGTHEEWLVDDIKKYGLNDVVKVCGLVSREQAIKKQKESQLLLLLLWNDKDEKGVYTGKIFEYLGSQRPILAIGGSGSIVKELLTSTNSGHFAENKRQLKTILLQYYQDFIAAGTVKYSCNGKLKDYTYNSIAEKYSSILNEVTAK